MPKENKSLSEKMFIFDDYKTYGKVALEEDIKEFIKIHIEDLDWLWEIHPKIYNRIVAKFKERAGEKLI